MADPDFEEQPSPIPLRPKVKRGLYKPKREKILAKHFSLSYMKKKLNSPVASENSDFAPNIQKLRSQNSDRDESSTFGQSHKQEQEEVRTLTIHDID